MKKTTPQPTPKVELGSVECMLLAPLFAKQIKSLAVSFSLCKDKEYREEQFDFIKDYYLPILKKIDKLKIRYNSTESFVNYIHSHL